MSAINVIIHPERGSLFADGAFYDLSGVVRVFHRKITLLENCKAAIVNRGAGSNPLLLLTALGHVVTRTDLLAALPECCRKMAAEGRRRVGTEDPRIVRTELSIVVWDDQANIPRYYAVGCDNAVVEGMLAENGVRPFEVAEMGICAFSPEPATQPEKILGKPLRNVADVIALDHRTDGLAIMREQRRTLVDMPGAGKISIVGGFCDMAQVTHGGVTIERLETWQDKVGERIAF